MPKISVLIPTYNGEKYISQTIESVLKQSFEDFEVIVSDNDSTDGTAAIVAKFKDPRIRYHRNVQNVGYTRNVHQLIHKFAKGDYSVILCDDDHMNYQFLGACSRIFLKDNNISLVFSGIITEDEFLEDSYCVTNDLPEVIAGRDFYALHLTGGVKGLVLSNVLFKTDLAVQAGVFSDFDRTNALDWELRLKLAILGSVGFVKEPLVTYRWRAGNLSNNPDKMVRWFKEDIICIENAIEFGESTYGKGAFEGLKKKAIATRCKGCLSALPMLKLKGLNYGCMCDVLRYIYTVDKKVFINPIALKAAFSLLPKDVLAFIFKVKHNKPLF